MDALTKWSATAVAEAKPRLSLRPAIAYADAFRAIMLAFAVATLLVPLLRNITTPKPVPAQSR